ncbi:cytochrome P450 family protein [Pleomassaria siparia CBS 279.74]|uniref:Cytochrome P450 family protein n=1 Tax=Pleomassaria siparia CBS 279.74 TaxID=1314801 RepID=A0A6G1K2H3_9PLEO|nr:cytochrome P450 family protein [Pleomassaria siparia CBS 279.74]
MSCLIIVHRFIIVIYRLLYSPLAQFPGPKLAAASGLYETYYNFIKNGKYVFEVERLHKIYGPIVRVNPHELSIQDAEFYDKIYVSGSVRQTENYSHFVDGVDFEGSHFLTTPHHLHRVRRKPIEPYFSRLGINQLEPIIHELVEKFLKRFEALEGTGAVVRLDHAMLCYTGDMISRVCCEDATSLLDDKDFSKDWYESLHTIIKSMPLFEAFPFIIRFVRLIPESVLMWVDPRSQLFNNWRDMAEKHVLQVKKEGGTQNHQARSRGDERTTLLHHLVYSDLPESELSVPRLVNEAQVLLGAGTVGTARVLDLTCYYILASRGIRTRLTNELDAVMTGWPTRKPTWSQLEKLPYLQAVIREGLRLSYGIMRRLPRVSPNTTIQFRAWTIPAGVPVGMSAYMQHTDPDVFPEPFQFRPERWLPENVTPLMNRNFVPFAKGSRNCLGMNLAYAEMSHIISALFRENGPKFDLYHTDESDISLVHDFVVPLPKVDTKGFRVVFS